MIPDFHSDGLCETSAGLFNPLWARWSIPGASGFRAAP
jgi:hypothetical protein